TTIQFLVICAQTSIPDKTAQPPRLAQSHIGQTTDLQSPTLSTISRGFNSFNVFARGKESGDVIHKWWDGYQWGLSVADLESLGSSGGFPAAVSDNSSKIDVFAPAADGSLQHKYFNGYNWEPSVKDWHNFGGKVDQTFAPSTTSWAPGRIHVFFRGVDGGLYLNYYDGSNWGPKDGNEDLGGSCSRLGSQPQRYKALNHNYWDGGQWSCWETFDLDAELSQDTPCAVSWVSIDSTSSLPIPKGHSRTSTGIPI
ncbi:MAG: hypothetical protein LQ338_006800, partial [Usnochroma carphineum]